jgi:hypothetical protein
MDAPEPWHWRLALQIAAQMPEEEQDALKVLECVEQLLNLCYQGPPPAPGPGGGGQLVRFPGGSSSPSRRASSSGRASVLPK